MNIQVLGIQPRKQGHLFDVQVLVGRDRHVFKVEVQDPDKPPIQVASADRYSRRVMQHDARLMSQIDRLVLKVYNGQEVALPLTITEHLPLRANRCTQASLRNRHAPKELEITALQPAF